LTLIHRWPHALRDEYTRTHEPARARAAEILDLERTLCDLVNQVCALAPAEIGLPWKTALPDLPIPRPQTNFAPDPKGIP
jgi:hypothetical protein